MKEGEVGVSGGGLQAVDHASVQETNKPLHVHASQMWEKDHLTRMPSAAATKSWQLQPGGEGGGKHQGEGVLEKEGGEGAGRGGGGF